MAIVAQQRSCMPETGFSAEVESLEVRLLAEGVEMRQLLASQLRV